MEIIHNLNNSKDDQKTSISIIQYYELFPGNFPNGSISDYKINKTGLLGIGCIRNSIFND